MEYAKFINEYTIEPAPRVVKIGKKRIANPKPEILEELGYKPVVEDEKPEYDEETQYLVPRYTQTAKRITRHWEIRDIERGGE